MMKFPGKCIVTAAIAMTLVGCSDDNPFNLGTKDTGRIAPRIVADGSVVDGAPTRAYELDVPELSAFSLSLVKSDGTYAHEWASVEDFPMDRTFPIGEYKMSVSYGTAEEEGFGRPYFYGESVFTVRPEEPSEPVITAVLSNTMVSVAYTEAFKTYFSTYAVTLHSEGHGYNTLPADAQEPIYLVPGKVDVSLAVTMPDGKEATLQPTVFNAEPRHHYTMTLDVNDGNVGVSQLVISFDETLTDSNIEIDLTDDLVNAPSPEVNVEGFEAGEERSILEGADPGNLSYSIFAFGGIASAKFTIESEGYTTPLGSEIDFVALTSSQQQQATELGFDVKGLYRNVDKIATLDITRFAAQLPPGSHKLSLVVKDLYTRVNEPVVLQLDITAQDIALLSIDPVKAGATEATLHVAYNGTDLKNRAVVKVLHPNGRYAAVDILSVTEETTRALGTEVFEMKTYAVKVALPLSGDDLKLQLFNGSYKVADETVEVEEMKYTVEADAFATRVRLKLIPEDETQLDAATQLVRVFVDDREISERSLDREDGYIMVRGLNPSTQYTITTTSHGAVNAEMQTTTTVTTEAGAAQIANGDFSDLHETINVSSIDVGGAYKASLIGSGKTNKSSVLVNEPTGWASINAKTFYDGAQRKNTWYQVPSTMASDGVVTIRSVAYDHNGQAIAQTSSSLIGSLLGGSVKYYNTNVPTIANRAAGELFLGTYTFDGTEHREDGVEFTERPMALNFTCNAYESYEGESGLAYVEVLDAEGNVIASGNKIVSESGSYSVAIAGYESFGVKAAKIKVGFKSSTADPVQTATPDDLDDGCTNNNTTVPVNAYKSLSIGSVMKISNVYVTY